MEILWYIGCMLGGYLLGCINTAAILARAKGFDIRTKGSGNAGASNALVTMGKGAAVCSALIDILKAFLPVWLLIHVIPVPDTCHGLPVFAGVSVIFGHMYPFWMQFRGGKGFASLLGMVLALDWRFFLVCIVILAVILFTARYIALATIVCAGITPIFWGIFTGKIVEAMMLAVVGICMIYRHIPNLKRIANGTEIKFMEKKKENPDV